MAPTPRPEGWKGGSEDFTFVRTLDGHIGDNLHEDSGPGASADEETRRNARTTSDAFLGGDYAS